MDAAALSQRAASAGRGDGWQRGAATAATFEAPASSGWIDVSQVLREGLPVWPGDPPFALQPLASVQEHGVAVSSLSMCTHTGTHIDAPSHFIAGAAAIDALPLEALVGPCEVLDLAAALEAAAQAGAGRAITAELLEVTGGPRAARLLLKTHRDPRLPGAHLPDDDPDLDAAPEAPPGWLAADGAAWLVARGARLVGIDTLSVDALDSTSFPAHHALLGQGVVIVEGLDLAGVERGSYDLIALPLRIAGADGSPARVLLRPVG